MIIQISSLRLILEIIEKEMASLVFHLVLGQNFAKTYLELDKGTCLRHKCYHIFTQVDTELMKHENTSP